MSQGLLEAQNRRVPEGLNRRTFLKLGVSVGAAVGGGLMLGFSLPAASQGEAPKGKSVIGGDANEAPQSGVFEPNAFVQIDATGKVTLVIPKVEMGQGVYTSIPMLIAEELEVPLDSVVIDHAPPNEKLFMDPLQRTSGSAQVLPRIQTLAPTNFPWSNPTAIKATIDQGGRNFVVGGRALAHDMSSPPRIPANARPSARRGSRCD